MLGFFMACAVNHRMNPDNKSSSESSVEAITAIDRVSTDATTFPTKRIRLIILDRLMARRSPLARFANSS